MAEPIPPNVRRHRGQLYEEKFSRYSANAEVTAAHADRAADTWKRSASFNDSAAGNADQNGDGPASQLYDDMREAAEDAAAALKDYAEAARKVAAYFKSKEHPHA